VRIFDDSRLQPVKLDHGLTLWGSRPLGPSQHARVSGWVQSR
jgi:hypothetical protein